jgi:hypothetical protein
MTTTITGVDDGTAGYGVQGSTSLSLFNGFWTAGVRGESTSTFGVYASSQSGIGLYASTAATNGNSAVYAEHNGSGTGSTGVYGTAQHGTGVAGTGATGVTGTSSGGAGVVGKNGNGSAIAVALAGGVHGDSDNGWGVVGTSLTYDGVRGENNGNGSAIHGVCHSTSGKAGLFEGTVHITGALEANGSITGSGQITANPRSGDGVTGWSHDAQHSGVVALHDGGGHGLYAKSNGLAGQFDGNVNINGVLQVSHDIMLTGADCAEDFDLAPGTVAEPGSLLVIADDGRLALSSEAYDSRVAGVVSGAGNFRPALRLDHRSGQKEGRGTIALVGKAFCKVDASKGAIRVGDLLTTSDIPGHAMRVSDPGRAIGAIVGKALAGLRDGSAMIPILIALQ